MLFGCEGFLTNGAKKAALGFAQELRSKPEMLELW